MIVTEYLATSCDHWFLYKLNTDFPWQSLILHTIWTSICVFGRFSPRFTYAEKESERERERERVSDYSYAFFTHSIQFMQFKWNKRIHLIGWIPFWKQTTNTPTKAKHTETDAIIITHGVYSLNIAPCIGILFIHTPTYASGHDSIHAHVYIYWMNSNSWEIIYSTII